MRLALTGTNGFLGRAFAAAALAAGDTVRGLVLPGTTGVPRGVEPVAGALSDEAALRELLRGCDALVHLAALGVQGRDRDFERMTQVNVVEPVGLLQAAAAAGVQRVIAVGTCLEYAGHGRLPDAPCASDIVVGEDAPTEPDDAYGATKAAGGLLLRARARALGLPLRYLRFASMYGPGDDAAKLLPGAIRAAVTRTPFPMTPGAQVREWLHVDDGVAALRAALAAPLRGVEVVNVGTGEGVALRDVVGMVFEQAGADPGLIRAGERTYRPGEVHRIVMDCARARGLLAGWAPQRSLRSGIAALLRSEREEGRERT